MEKPMEYQEDNVEFYINMIEQGDIESFTRHMEIKTVCERSEIIHSESELGGTLLTRACSSRENSRQLVEYMLTKCGGNPNHGDHYTALTVARELAIVMLLVKHGGNVNMTPSPVTCKTVNSGKINSFHSCTLELDSIDSDKFYDFDECRETKTCLMSSINLKKKEIFEFLLENGADVNVRNERGVTALHIAVKHGSLDVVKSLLNHGAKYSWPSSPSYLNLLYISAAYSEVYVDANHGEEIIEYLIEKTKPEEIDIIHAYELLGVRLLTKATSYLPDGSITPEALDDVSKYWKKAMLLRQKISFRPLLKTLPQELQMPYCNIMEPQTMSELEDVLNNPLDLPLQALLVSERILGKDNEVFLSNFKKIFAILEDTHRLSTQPRWYIGLLRYAISILEAKPELIPTNLSLYRKLGNLLHVMNKDEFVESLKSTGLTFIKLDEMRFTLSHCYMCEVKNIFMVFIHNWVNMIEAADSYHTETVDTVVRNVCAVNPTDYWGRGILHETCGDIHQALWGVFNDFLIDSDKVLEAIQKSYRVTKFLLERGAKVNHRDKNGFPALFIIPDRDISEQESEVIFSILKLMVSYGAHLDIPADRDWGSYKQMIQLFPQLPKIFRPSLQCLCAQVLTRNKIPYRDRVDVPKLLTPFISVHDADSNNYNL